MWKAGADVVEELRELARRVRVLEALRGLVVLAVQVVDLRLIERRLRLLQRVGGLRGTAVRTSAQIATQTTKQHA